MKASRASRVCSNSWPHRTSRKPYRHLFFAERRLTDVEGVAGVVPRLLQRVGVLGAGTMGSGIALAFAQAGYPVAVVDPDDAAIERARRTVMENLAYQVRKGRLDQRRAWEMGRSITFGADVETLAQSDLVVEAIVERLDAKVAAFRALAAVLAPEAILATNTSTLGRSTCWRRRWNMRNASSVCISSCRPTSCRCSKSCAALDPPPRPSRRRSISPSE